jgi:hypothetical protein
MNGGRARRHCWATITEYTQATPPLRQERYWRIWMADTSSIVQGWGGQIGSQIAADDPIKDGTYYKPTDDDRIANDWELLERLQKTREL